MSTCHREASTGAVLLAMVCLHWGNAAEASPPATDEDTLNCQPQIQRIAVWSHGPRKKVLETPRYITRVRLVCKGEEKASVPRRVAVVPTFGPRNR